MSNSNTLIIIKPDAVERGLSGKIIDRFEQKGYKISTIKMMEISENIAEQHYVEHKDKPFFGELVDFITSGPSIVLKLEGNNVVNAARKMIGSTDPSESMPGTIRGDFGNSIASNLIHASDSEQSASREIALFFREG
ncbi:MAG TPA: nucleoside-diphosphate kinase [Fusobacteria bacterium]|nr:nucleoside-diphosphate kinase [Fusobacteriota bacterium]